jgi:hypothetical protein
MISGTITNRAIVMKLGSVMGSESILNDQRIWRLADGTFQGFTAASSTLVKGFSPMFVGLQARLRLAEMARKMPSPRHMHAPLKP